MARRTSAILLAIGLAATVNVRLLDAIPEKDVDTRNLISNGSFEILDSQGRPAEWTTSQGAEPNENPALPVGLSWIIDREVEHDGQQSLRLSVH